MYLLIFKVRQFRVYFIESTLRDVFVYNVGAVTYFIASPRLGLVPANSREKKRESPGSTQGKGGLYKKTTNSHTPSKVAKEWLKIPFLLLNINIISLIQFI